MKTILSLLLFISSILSHNYAQEIVFNSSRGTSQFDKVFFLNDNTTIKTINLLEENPYIALNFNAKVSTPNVSKPYLISLADVKTKFNEASPNNQIIFQDFDDTARFLIHPNCNVSWIPFHAIKSYKTAAIAYCMHLSTTDYETTIAAQSTVKAYNCYGEEIFSEVIDKYISSVGITPGGEFLAYSWDCDWPNGDLYEPGNKIIDLSTEKVIFETKSKSGYVFTWQIENGIGWHDIYNNKNVDFYYLLNGDIVIIDNNLGHGVIRIDHDRITLMKNNGERYSKPRHHNGINVLNNDF